jgi:hypothetical protein
MKYNKHLVIFILCISLSMNTSHGTQGAYGISSCLKTGGEFLRQSFNAIKNSPSYISIPIFGALLVVTVLTTIKKWFNGSINFQNQSIKLNDNQADPTNLVTQIRHTLSFQTKTVQQEWFEQLFEKKKNEDDFDLFIKNLQQENQNNADLDSALLAHYRDELLDKFAKVNRCNFNQIIQGQKDKCLFSPEEIKKRKNNPSYSASEPMLIKTNDGTNRGREGLRYKAIEQVESTMHRLLQSADK